MCGVELRSAGYKSLPVQMKEVERGSVLRNMMEY